MERTQRGKNMNDSEVIVLLGEIARLRRLVRALNGFNRRLAQTLGEIQEENKILRERLERIKSL